MTSSTGPAYTRGPSSVEGRIARLPPRARQAMLERLDLLTSTLIGTPVSSDAAIDLVVDEVGDRPDLLWLAWSILHAELPSAETMMDVLVRARLGGTWAALAPAFDLAAEARAFRPVEVVRGAVTCDVHTTAGSDFLSGIQRVVRETTTRWHAEHEVEFVGWAKDGRSMRRLEEREHRTLFDVDLDHPVPDPAPVVVPWESTHLWVEVITDRDRTSRLLALAEYSRNEVGVLGFDSIPITSSVTVAPGMTSHFARGVAAQRRADRVATISAAAAEEFRGVMDMGAGRRDPAPDVAAVPLAVAAQPTTEDDLREGRATLVIEGLPMVLVVGSHEPRKNHLAVLQAADLLWREGHAFNLVLVGAGSWNAGDYTQVVASLAAAGRPIQSIRGLPDRLLWAAYRLAHCTVFPSLNEGFGLPVAESLAAGTPVITSGYGSMRDIAAPEGTPWGALFVDPRDDDSLTEALRTMLTDPATHERLRDETALHPTRTWDDYARELWAYLVEGERPDGDSA